ncbi:MAG: AzlD domain-containing protein [Legionellaceae bacterium]|nr:AzlD domain-containing protein [Legionellaceae bacterium]
MNHYALTVVLSLCALAIVTRAFPFMFTEKLSGNVKMQALGKRLTAYIMMLLVIYEINPASFKTNPFGLPAMISLFIVIVAHLLLKKPLLSMVLGTVSFVLLKQHLG